MATKLTTEHVLKLIRQQAEQAGSQAKLARAWGISGAYLSDVLRGERPISDRIALQLGLRIVVSYQRIERGAA